MAEDWIEEGLVQVRLAAAWQGYALLLEPAGAVGDLPGQLRGLATAILRPGWLPGAAETLADWLAAPLPKPAVLADGEWPGRLADRLRPLGVGGSLDDIRRCVRECGQQVWTGAALEGSGKPLSTPDALSWRPGVAARVRFWIEQARVLCAWLAGSPARMRLARSLGLVGEAAALRSECERVGSLVAATGRQRWSLFGRSQSPGVLPEVDDLLQRCGVWFDRLLADPALDGLALVLDRLESRVTQLLGEQPVGWPPARLAQLQCDLMPLQVSLLLDLETSPDQVAGWLGELEKNLPGLTPAEQARLILTRTLVETASARPLPDQAWDRLSEALGDLATTERLHVEILRTPGPLQPAAAFLLEEDSAALAPRLTRVGLVVRAANSPWFGFPPARVAKPSPEQIVNQLAARMGPQPETGAAGLVQNLVAFLDVALPGWSLAGLGEMARDCLWRLLHSMGPEQVQPCPAAAATPCPANTEQGGPAETMAPEELWTRLPPPPEFAPTAAGGEMLTAPPLVRWHSRADRPSSRRSLAERAGEARTAFAAWLETPTGLEWFHQAAWSATNPDAVGHHAALAWLNKLVAESWCICYPQLASPGGVPIWPTDASTETLRWAFDPSAAGTVLRVDRFAPSAARACCVLSQGPRLAGTALDQAARLSELADSRDDLAGPLAGPTGCLLEATRAHVVRDVALTEPEGLLLPVLDGLVQVAAQQIDGIAESSAGPASLPAETMAGLDELLRTARTWGQRFGLEILPRRWRFQEPLERQQLHADESSGIGLFFRTAERAGQVYRIRAFGLSRNGAAVRSCRLSVSAGPAPPGFTALEEIVRQPRFPEEEVWQQRLRGWREASLSGTLDVVAVELFVDFWGTAGEPWRQRDPHRAAQFAERLADVLLQALGLRAFCPGRYQDHPPGWLEVLSERGMVSGRVRRVFRPGLQDAMGRLRLPAIVQVE